MRKCALTVASRGRLHALVDRDQIERLALHLASRRYVTQADGAVAVFEPHPALARQLPPGLRLVQVASMARRPDLSIPIEAGEVVSVLESHSGPNGAYVFALVVSAKLPAPRIDDAEQERIARRLADALWDEIMRAK